MDLNAWEFLLKGGEEVGGEGSGGGHDRSELEPAEIELGDDGVLDKGEHDGRHNGGEVDLVGDERAQEGAQLEPVHGHHLALVPERGAANAGEAVDVEEGDEAEGGGGADHLLADAEKGGAEVGHQVAVCEHDALGGAGGAGGEGQRAQVALCRRLLSGLARPRAVAGVEEVVPIHGRLNSLFPDYYDGHAKTPHLVMLQILWFIKFR